MKPWQSGLGASPAIRLREAIEAAWYWGELEEIVQEVEQAFQAGFLTQSAAERLALLVVERSRCVTTPSGVVIRITAKGS